MGAHLPYLVDKAAHDSLIVSIGNAGHFIEQVETQKTAWHLTIALGKNAPLVSATIESLDITEKVLRLGGWIHTIARCTMQVETKMDSILSGPFHGSVNIAQDCFVHLIIFAGTAPVPITQR